MIEDTSSVVGVLILNHQVEAGPCFIGPEAGRGRSTAVSGNRHCRLTFILILDDTIEWNMAGLAC